MKKIKFIPLISCFTFLPITYSLVSCSTINKDDIQKIFVKVPKYKKYDTFQKSNLDVSVLTKDHVIHHISTGEFKCSINDGEKLLDIGTFDHSVSFLGLTEKFQLVVEDIRHAEFKIRTSDYYSSAEPSYSGERIECYITNIVDTAPISCFYRSQQNSYFTVESLTHNGVEIPYTKSSFGNNTEFIKFQTLTSGEIRALIQFNSGPKEFSSGCIFDSKNH